MWPRGVCFASRVAWNQECRMITPSSPVDPSLIRLYQSYADGGIGRRGFIRRASALAGARLSIPAWMLADQARAGAAQAAAAGTTAPMLDLAEWTYFFVGVERAELARAAQVNRKEMDGGGVTPAPGRGQH